MKKNPDVTPTAHHEGHRERLRQRFLSHDGNLPTYELLELFLGYAIPRGDTKPLAKSLLEQSQGKLYPILAHPEKFKLNQKPFSQCQLSLVKLVRILMQHALSEELTTSSLIINHQSGSEYLRTLFMNETNEKIVVLFLNSRHELLDTYCQGKGTVNMAPIYVREIVKQALSTGATAIILAHNHPSGTLKPSGDDIRVTRELQTGLRTINVSLLDHVIVGINELYSMKREGDI